MGPLGLIVSPTDISNQTRSNKTIPVSMGWDGMGWDGIGWDGMGWDACTYMSTLYVCIYIYIYTHMYVLCMYIQSTRLVLDSHRATFNLNSLNINLRTGHGPPQTGTR